MAEQKASGFVHILVALIGVAGSLGVAWLTTQHKFASELDSKAPEIAHLKAQLEIAEKRLVQVEDRMRKLDVQLEMAQSAASTLVKAGSSLFSKKKE